MPKSRISINIHKQAVGDTAALNTFLKALDPVAVLVLDELDYARDVRGLLPECIVIYREHGGGEGDETVHLRTSPEAWIAHKQRQLEQVPGLWMHTTNEPAFDEFTLKWHIRVMELAVPIKMRLVVGNWGAGIIPKPEDLPSYPSLPLLDQHRDLFILGAHEYGCGVMTSGLVGGAPDDPAHPNYIWPENWPESTKGITKFHCGRFNFMTDYARKLGYKAPRVILTEHGMDDLSDIKFWSEKLKVSPGYGNIRGWKSLTVQWFEWWGFRQGWSVERAYFEQLKWVNEAIYAYSEVEAQCIFSWGHTSKMWEQFCIKDALELQTLLIEYAQERAPSEPPPVEEPPPTTEPPPAEEPDPEPYQATITIQLKEKTRRELDLVSAYLLAKMQAEYAFLNFIRYSLRLEADDHASLVRPLRQSRR